MVSVSDFQDWKSNHVTKAFFEACDIRIEDAKEMLASQAGMDSISDSCYRGFILAYNEMKDFRVDEGDQQ